MEPGKVAMRDGSFLFPGDVQSRKGPVRIGPVRDVLPGVLLLERLGRQMPGVAVLFRRRL